MLSLLYSAYLKAMLQVQGFIHEERGDQTTPWIISLIIAVVGGGLILAALRAFFPVIWADITSRITGMW